MRILLLLRDNAPNGITTYNRVLAQALRAQGHEVLSWPPLPQPGAARRWRWLPPAHPLMEPLLRPWLRRLQPDLVYAHSYTQARFAHALKASTGIPWVACMHNGHAPARMAQWRELYDNADGVVTMCESLRDRYTELLQAPASGHPTRPAPPVVLSRLPTELPPLRVRRPASDPQAPLTLGYCSRLSGLKGPRCEAWLEAVARLPADRLHRVLVIGGGSHLPKLKACAARLGLDAEFTGLVNDPSPWLDRIDVITGAGYALMEGLLRGSAAVGLGFGGCIGAVTPARLAEAYAYNFGDHCPSRRPSDPDTIAAALTEAIASLGTSALAQVHADARQRFASEGVARELLGALALSAAPLAVRARAEPVAPA